MTETSSWNPSLRRPSTSSAKFTLAYARVRSRGPADSCRLRRRSRTTSATPPAPDPGATLSSNPGSAEQLYRGHLRDAESLGKRVRELLAWLCEARLQELQKGRSLRGTYDRVSEDLKPNHRRVDAWPRVERGGRHPAHNPRRCRRLNRHREVRTAPDTSHNPLGDFLLDHHDKQRGWGRDAEVAEQHWARDVVGQVSDELVWSREMLIRKTKRVFANNLHIGRHQPRQGRGQISVQLDRDDSLTAPGQCAGQDTKPWADFKHLVSRVQIGRGCNLLG